MNLTKLDQLKRCIAYVNEPLQRSDERRDATDGILSLSKDILATIEAAVAFCDNPTKTTQGDLENEASTWSERL
jgi:hypothetical protein